MKKQVKKVVVERLEGPINRCGMKEFSSLSAASAWLHGQSHTFPAKGGYDKHDFSVEFEDGEVYEGRLYCKHMDCSNNDLDIAGRIKNWLLITSGRMRPAWMDDSRWEAIRKDDVESGASAYAEAFLDGYEI